MPFVQAKCTNCGGVLAVDNSKDAWICPFCETPFIVEKAINNYSIKADVVNIYGDVNKDFTIKAGVLISYNGEADEVVIPDSVKEIQFDCFKNSAITKITFPNTIKNIGSFKGCRYLSTISIPDSVTDICSAAFNSCSRLSEIVIPDSVTDICSDAFADCTSLKKITLSNSIDRIYPSTFSCCESLESIEIPDNVTFIGGRAFSGCKSLKNIKLPKNLKFIGRGAFENCVSLTEITIPDSIENIDGYEAFNGCSGLKKINISREASMRLKSNNAYGQSRFFGTSINQCKCCGGELVKALFGRKCSICGIKEK